MSMKETNKLVRSLQQLDNILKLTEGNFQQAFIHHHLLSVRIALKTQLTNLTNSSTIEE